MEPTLTPANNPFPEPFRDSRIRVLAARWIGLEPSVHSTSFLLSTASLSAVGYDQELSRPVIQLWNDTHHVRP
jgi:hypothetical protein